jgi:KaiC/GvpD/RAD55 family RecA-like ATPase
MRVSTGIPRFDSLLDGGLLEDRLYVLSGPPGSGKTTFSAHFLTEGALSGERCLFLSMHENKSELAHDMGSYDFGFDRALESSNLEFLNIFDANTRRLLGGSDNTDFSTGVKNTTNRLVSFINSRGIDRLVIDSAMILQYFFPESEDAFIQFLTSLKRIDATTILISEMTDPSSYADEHYLSHGVIFMHNYLDATGMTRGIQIIKMRGTDIDSDIRAVEFTDDGLQVHPDQKLQG